MMHQQIGRLFIKFRRLIADPREKKSDGERELR